MNNPYSLPGDPSLPPGVTAKMIDEAMGYEPDASELCTSCNAALKMKAGLCRECYYEGLAERQADEAQDATE